MTGQRVARRSSFGSMVRRRLSDITNLQAQPQIPREDEVPTVISSSDKEYLDQLVKENRALMELLDDRNKIIELTGSELQKLRVNMQKMQLQNWNLAQSNSRILTELNLSREKLKSLQHELVCKDALFKAKKMEMEGREKINCQKVGTQEEKVAAAESLPQANNHNKARNPSRGRPVRSRSMGPSTTSEQVSAKERTENKRSCVRRQSSRFESNRQEASENFFELEDVKFEANQPLGHAMDEDRPTRSSVGRPVRRAVVKVQSYKEIPLTTKLRRSE